MQSWRKSKGVGDERKLTTLWFKRYSRKLRGGAGQCSTCFISVEGGNKNSLSPLTSVEEEKLKNRPDNWRLACQTLIKSSSVILTKPQSPPSNLEELKKISENKKLPR